MPLIDIQHLTKVYDIDIKQPGMLGSLRSLMHQKTKQVSAVKDISFSIEPGEIVAFIGPNGAGKTTTLKILSGILWPTSGDVRVFGYIPWKRQAEFQRQFGIVMGSKRQLWWDLPARDSFLLNKEIYDIPTSDYTTRLQTLSEALTVDHLLDVPVRQLSLGERMKCELIGALLHNPALLYLDEPTIGLDVVSINTVRRFLKQWNTEQGTTIIFTSHTMADVEAVCERAVVIDQGTIRYDGSLDDLRLQTDSRRRVVIQLQKRVAKSALERIGSLVSYEGNIATFTIPKDDTTEAIRLALDTLPIHDLSIQDRPLEDVIRDIFSNK